MEAALGLTQLAVAAALARDLVAVVGQRRTLVERHGRQPGAARREPLLGELADRPRLVDVHSSVAIAEPAARVLLKVLQAGVVGIAAPP